MAALGTTHSARVVEQRKLQLEFATLERAYDEQQRREQERRRLQVWPSAGPLGPSPPLASRSGSACRQDRLPDRAPPFPALPFLPASLV